MCNTGHDARRFFFLGSGFGIEFRETLCYAKVGPVTVDRMSTVGPKIMTERAMYET